MKNATRFACAALASTLLIAGAATAGPLRPAAGSGSPDAATTGAVAGTVSLPAPDGQLVTVPGASITLACAQQPARTDFSDGEGRFRFDKATAGTCVVSANLDGTRGTTSIEVRAGETTEVALVLEIEGLQQTVQVTGTAGEAGSVTPPPAQRVSASTLQTAPLASERFQDALPLIPGVVRGPDGLLNVSGSRSNQVALMLSHSLGTDPVTGEDATNLPIDAVDEIHVRRAAYAPEYGLSSGAVTTVEMRQGGEKWKVTVNDLQPRLRRRAGKFRGIESWTPRFTIGGPLAGKTLTVLQSVQYEFGRSQVYSLPELERDVERESFQSYTRLDWTPSSTHHVAGSASVAPRKTTYAGLDTFNPEPVAPTIEKHDVFGTVTHQLVTTRAGLLDTWVSVKGFASTVDPSKGVGPMVLAPDVNSGSYFNSQDLDSHRVEFVSTYSFTPFGEAHVLKVSVGGGHEGVDGTSRSRPVRIVRADGTLAELTEFVGTGTLNRQRTGVGGFVQDSWTISPRVTLQYGARYEYETMTSLGAFQPRASLVATLTADGRTVLRAGAGVFNNLLPLNAGTFEQTEQRVVTRFDASGSTPLSPSVVLQNRVDGRMRRPRSGNWTAEIDREIGRNLLAEVGFQQRDTYDDTVIDVTSGAEGPALVLRSNGHSRYREARVVARYKFGKADQVVGAYTRTSATGNLNGFNAYFGDRQNPVIRPDQRGRLPWDSPNRVLVYGTVSLPWKLTFFPVLDVRTGFPQSVVDENRDYVGRRSRAGRYPEFVSVDMQLTKKFRAFGHNVTVGVKVFNLTNHFNPRDFQENLASGDPGALSNGVPRTIRGKWVVEF